MAHDVPAAVYRKLNITWDDAETSARLQDVTSTVSSALSGLLGYPADHVFTEADGGGWLLFLNGCLYEFSDAWDDFQQNYEREILAARLKVLGGDARDGDG